MLQILSIILYPFSLCYRTILALRRYSIHHWYSLYKSPVPVIAVGNIAVGGTGKTPITSYILSLCEKYHISATLISRGYGGNGTRYPIYLDKASKPSLVGDEPAMLARRHKKASCLVDPQRKRAMLFALEHTAPDCFVLDDAMQHIYVARDANIVIVTIHDILEGWNKVLPYGRWREGASALRDASIFCIRASKKEWSTHLSIIEKRLGVYRKPIYSFDVTIQGLYTFYDDVPFTVQGDYSIVCGIGNPRSFYTSIIDYLGYTPIEAIYCSDHAKEEELVRAIDRCTSTTIICTEKDMVKLCTNSQTKQIVYAKANCVFGDMLYTKESFDAYCKRVLTIA